MRLHGAWLIASGLLLFASVGQGLGPISDASMRQAPNPDALTDAGRLLEQRASVGPPVPGILQAQRSVDAAKDLVEIEQRVTLSEREQALQKARRATQHQVHALGLPSPSGPPACQNGALARLSDRLSSRPGPLANPLGETVAAFCSFAVASEEAFSDSAPLERPRGPLFLLDPSTGSIPEATEPGRTAAALFDAGVEPAALANLLAARERLLTAAAGLDRSAEAAGVGGVPVCEPGFVCIDLREDHDRTYTSDYRLQIDRAGNDTYRNTAGGAERAAAALFDLGGNDTYRTDSEDPVRGFAGGGVLGSGLLYDSRGNDTYHAVSHAWGRSGGIHGGTDVGVGFLMDRAGHDTYHVLVEGGVDGANGGSWGGAGLLIDEAGNDTYAVTDPAPTDDGSTPPGASSTGGTIGVNGGSERGVAFLYDGSGSDTYFATAVETGPGTDAVNGGSLTLAGFLMDASGSDVYHVVAVDGGHGEGGINGGGDLGSGFLYDRAGDDTYRVSIEAHSGGGAVNGGASAGTGLLLDEAGDDLYSVESIAQAEHPRPPGFNGGGQNGLGLLLDSAGEDRFEEAHGYTCDNEQTDSCTRVPKGRVGLLADRSG